MSLSQRGLPDAVPRPPCWASPPDPGPADVPCQAMYPHAGTQHGLLCLARGQHDFLSQPHSQLRITPVHRGQGEKLNKLRPQITSISFYLIVRMAPWPHLTVSGAASNKMNSLGFLLLFPAPCYSKAEQRLSENLERGQDVGS